MRKLEALNGWRAEKDRTCLRQGRGEHATTSRPCSRAGRRYYWCCSTAPCVRQNAPPCGSVERSEAEWGKPRRRVREPERAQNCGSLLDIDYTGKHRTSHRRLHDGPGRWLAHASLPRARGRLHSNGRGWASGRPAGVLHRAERRIGAPVPPAWLRPLGCEKGMRTARPARMLRVAPAHRIKHRCAAQKSSSITASHPRDRRAWLPDRRARERRQVERRADHDDVGGESACDSPNPSSGWCVGSWAVSGSANR